MTPEGVLRQTLPRWGLPSGWAWDTHDGPRLCWTARSTPCRSSPEPRARHTGNSARTLSPPCWQTVMKF